MNSLLLKNSLTLFDSLYSKLIFIRQNINYNSLVNHLIKKVDKAKSDLETTSFKTFTKAYKITIYMSLKLLDSLINELYNQIRLKLSFSEFLGDFHNTLESHLLQTSSISIPQTNPLLVEYINEITTQI